MLNKNGNGKCDIFKWYTIKSFRIPTYIFLVIWLLSILYSNLFNVHFWMEQIIYLFWCLNYSIFDQWEPFQLVPVSSWHIPPMLEDVLNFWQCRAFQTLCIFPALTLTSAISTKTYGSFCGEWYSETKIWALDLFIATGMSLLLGTLSGRR